eukprot:TRINITY_DN5352_c0_g1_i1.p4 TRINITY_DN5352_c0_g1~~TRINITY_DN5352_c0_g1_i1.p4  ORF type:complete len:114 (-),score=5.71 TRINITY_DN5352_c0_g1_i1:498-839(-)
MLATPPDSPPTVTNNPTEGRQDLRKETDKINSSTGIHHISIPLLLLVRSIPLKVSAPSHQASTPSPDLRPMPRGPKLLWYIQPLPMQTGHGQHHPRTTEDTLKIEEEGEEEAQ